MKNVVVYKIFMDLFAHDEFRNRKFVISHKRVEEPIYNHPIVFVEHFMCDQRLLEQNIWVSRRVYLNDPTRRWLYRIKSGDTLITQVYDDALRKEANKLGLERFSELDICVRMYVSRVYTTSEDKWVDMCSWIHPKDNKPRYYQVATMDCTNSKTAVSSDMPGKTMAALWSVASDRVWNQLPEAIRLMTEHALGPRNHNTGEHI